MGIRALLEALEGDGKGAGREPDWEGKMLYQRCPVCGKEKELQCRCSRHDLEALRKGHGCTCWGGHRWDSFSGETIDAQTGELIRAKD